MRPLRGLPWLAIILPARLAAEDLTVPLPPGETPLGDLGIYRVTYQSYGQPPVEMPLSWTGHFTPASGISYLPSERVLGRSAILLHSPWRVPPGKVWVDYRIRLPEVTPITLSFGIAMGPDVAVPGKSDGVTFSGYVFDLDVHTGRELIRRHQDKAEWIDYRFDLSEYAGQEIILRLQTEPGPKNDPSWDYSYFGDAKIIVGEAKEGRAELLQRLTSSPAYQAAMEVGTKPLCNDPRNGVVPSNLFPCQNDIMKVGNAYRFIYQGADGGITYTYEPQTGTLDDFTGQVDGGRPFRPAQGGGATVTIKDGEQTRTVPAQGGKATEISLAQDRGSLTVRWDYEVVSLMGRPEAPSLQIVWTFKIIGKALVVSAACEQPLVSNFSLGEVGLAPLRKTFGVPYLLGQVHYLPLQNVFVCRYLDWTRSHSSYCPQGTATYEAKTDGSRNPLSEYGYIAVSPNVNEVLPNVPHPPSPYLELLGPRIMLDIWAHHNGTYQGDAENLRGLKDHGVDHLAIIQHVWQCYGYDVKLPDHLPANPQFGGDEGMIEFGRAANECGYLWSLHENYIDLYPDAPSYDPTARVLRADGSPSPAWYNPGTQGQSFGLKCNRALDYAKQNSPEIHRRYGTTAAYLDVHTCVPPWHQLDHEAGQPMAAMALAKVKYDTELFQFMRDTHGGPLFGEGANHFYWAGRCDGVEAQVVGGEHHSPFLDFDLLKLHPQMVNHGVGYYERWFERGYNHRWGFDTGTVEQVDKYRAQEVAYGHAGFIGSAQTDNLQWVAKEHHLMHAVQRLYGAAKPTEICYEVDGQFVSASVALVLGQTTRQRIRYDSGLTVWINWRSEPWEVEGRILPQWGFLALGPETEVYTALRDGKFADYADCPEYLFGDARTSFNMPYLRGGKDIEPRLRDFQYLGDNRIRLTYEWIINDTLDQDYTCFVHFINEGSTDAGKIEFQQDHALPKPTRQWQKGEVVVDGPYEITVPADEFATYDIVIGLYKGARVPLKGLQAGEDRILIGQLQLEREEGKIRHITLGNLEELARKQETGRADFNAHLNPPGTRIDFGSIATDGSVKINKGPDKLVIFPYPRDVPIHLRLNVKAVAPNAALERITVRALAAGDQTDLGPVDSLLDDGWLEVTLDREGAGRYVVGW